jgi:Cdc6-like AAA superfamily ATPase
VFGFAEKHERWECEVGHEIRTAFSRGEILESPRMKDLKEKAEARRLKKLAGGSLDGLSKLKSEIDKVRKSVSPGLLDKISEEKIKKIDEAIEKEEYVGAEKLIADMSKEIKGIVTSAEPKLTASIPTELQANVWVRSTISISNEGDAHACDIELSLDGLEVRGSPRIDFLEADNTKDIDIALRTDGAGSIPVTLSLNFGNSYDKSPLSAEFSEWVEAGVVPMTTSTETTLPTTKQTSTKSASPIEEWEPPKGLEGDMEVLAEYFALRRKAYQTAPANEALLDELHNRREDFAISSYFEIPTAPSDILQEWALPPNLRGNVHLDAIREDIVGRLVSAKPEQNFVIIGDPGVGKTVLLFEVMDRLMKRVPVGVITTPALGDAHLAFGTRLFYDDIPENVDLIDAINERQSQGLVVTAREADWQALPESFQGLFDRLTVPLFTKEDMVPLCHSMLEFSGLGYDKTAVKLLVDFAEGSPIYVWSLIRELMHSGIRTLSKTYIQEHATKGMANYVSMLLQRLLKDGKEFRPGGLHALTCMVFLTEYMDERQCHDLYFRTAAEVIAERTEEELNDSLHMVTFNHVMAYLSGEGAVVRFPHDTWVDVLGGAGSLNPFRAEIQTIHSAFEDTGAFNEVMKETVVDTWTILSSRYRRNSARNRDSFLALADTLLRNFTLADLKELEVDIDLVREVASSHSHLPLAAMLVSKLQTAEPSHASNVINIQDSVINRSNLA